MTFTEALAVAQRGYDAWSGKPHNARWVRRVDGTPIPNDLVVNIAEAFVQALASQKATLDGSSHKDERAQAPAPVGGEVVEARSVAHGVLLEAAWEAAAWLGAGDTVAEERLVPAILTADPDQAYARQALSELGFEVPALSPDPTEGGTDE